MNVNQTELTSLDYLYRHLIHVCLLISFYVLTYFFNECTILLCKLDAMTYRVIESYMVLLKATGCYWKMCKYSTTFFRNFQSHRIKSNVYIHVSHRSIEAIVELWVETTFSAFPRSQSTHWASGSSILSFKAILTMIGSTSGSSCTFWLISDLLRRIKRISWILENKSWNVSVDFGIFSYLNWKKGKIPQLNWANKSEW